MKSFLTKFNIYNKNLSSQRYILNVTKIHLRKQKNISFKSFYGKYKFYGFFKKLVASAKKNIYPIRSFKQRFIKKKYSKTKLAARKTDFYILEELDVLVNSLKKKN